MARPKKQPAQVKKAANDPVVARWESSQIMYGWDSRDRTPNPDYHAPIRMTASGVFLNDAGAVLERETVPAYILEAAETVSRDTTYHAPKQQELSMRDAMLGAGVQDTGRF
jgi:hypothetical protein